MDHDGIIPVDVKNSDLQQCSIRGWPDEHCQVIVHDNLAHGGANRVLYVSVRNAMLARWLPDPQIDNISCLTGWSQ